MQTIILDKVIENYHVGDNLSIVKMASLPSYPHLFKIEFPGITLIAKHMPKSRLYCLDFDKAYLELSSSKHIEVPMMTKDGHYYLEIDDQVLFLYNELMEITTPPSPTWWAQSLASIHSIDQGENFKPYFPLDFYKSTINLLDSAIEYIDISTKSKIRELLTGVKEKPEISHFAVCHNDPYNKNVMQKANNYYLIDTESMGLSPCEFDIQRLLHNYAIDFQNADAVLDFWHAFKKEYEILMGQKIDTELLKKLYILDFIRSISWLQMVCNQSTRADYERQKMALAAFSESLGSGIHTKILKKI